MSAQILDGKLFAAALKDQIAKEIAALKTKVNRVPCVASIIVGEDQASRKYVESQQKAAESLGISYKVEQLGFDVTQKGIIELIQKLNHDPTVHGMILNKPLPTTISFSMCVNEISPFKDIEGMSTFNSGLLLLGTPNFIPCTPAAALALLKSAGVDLKGKEAVVIGRSEILGKPLALLLLKEDMTVTICHSKTVDLPSVVKRADVVIAAVGQPMFINADFIKPSAIVIDAGINQLDGKTVGDVDFESCKNKASFITPVPGGVGPVTSVMLM
jgi:methylenetetrahydrofolate dehydrogenase (NADP+) / methenyltetrahydrofolate cyclohydrolase